MTRSIGSEIFHDGSKTPGFAGYEGTRTADNILRNVRARRPWCSDRGCDCRKWVNEGAPGRLVPSFLAMRRAFSQTGVWAQASSTADRLVFGVLGGVEIIDPQTDDSYYVQGKKLLSLRLPRNLWLPYRPFLKSEKPKLWGSHLYRYLDDEEVAGYLAALRPMLQSPGDRSVVDRLLMVVGGDPDAAKSSNGRHKLPLVADKTLEKVELFRKYGPAGEGKEHAALKRYIYDHPHVLGVVSSTSREMESRDDTGDRVDVAFATGGARVVVHAASVPSKP